MTKEGRAEATLLKAHWLLEEIAAPLRNRPITEITPPQILAVLRTVEVKEINVVYRGSDESCI